MPANMGKDQAILMLIIPLHGTLLASSLARWCVPILYVALKSLKTHRNPA